MNIETLKKTRAYLEEKLSNDLDLLFIVNELIEDLSCETEITLEGANKVNE